MDACDLAIGILGATQDGDRLRPQDLYLVECAVNGRLTEGADETFARLYEMVTAGTYQEEK